MVTEKVGVELDVDKDEDLGSMWTRCFPPKVCGVETFCTELLDPIIAVAPLTGSQQNQEVELKGVAKDSG